jgi:hypothetical protein
MPMDDTRELQKATPVRVEKRLAVTTLALVVAVKNIKTATA